nr:hypothetical protein BaRGS_005110 [Batillaria attramentaria]
MGKTTYTEAYTRSLSPVQSEVVCDASNGGKSVEERLPHGQKVMARMFGHFFERVSIEARLVSDQLEEETDEILTELTQNWQLKFLKLRIMPAPCEGCTVLLSILRKVLRRATGVQMLVFAVSRYQNCEEAPLCVQLLEAVADSSSFTELTALHLYWLADEEIEEAISSPLSLPPTVELVSKLPALQHLLVRSINLSNRLLQELSARGRCRLRSLSVSVLALSFDDRFTPEVSSAAWAEVTSACPDLEVHCIVKELVPESELDRLFKPESPIVSLQFHKKCFFDGPKHCLELVSFSEKFASSMKSFICSEDCDSSVFCDGALVSMVTACTELQHLVFNGGIQSKTIMHLASLERKWRRFEFTERKIATGTHVAGYAADDVRRRELDELCDFVSKRLGCVDFQRVPWEDEDYDSKHAYDHLQAAEVT